MAGGGFRPPQFSEETAWLPPWLQPDQFQLSGADVAIDQTPFSLRCTSDPESLCGPHHAYIAKEEDGIRGDGTWGSFHLYLSGEGNSSSWSTLPSRHVTPLDLHLSSEGISQFVSEQCCIELQHALDDIHTEKSLPLILVSQNKISSDLINNNIGRISPPRDSPDRNDSDKQHLRNHEEASHLRNGIRQQDKMDETIHVKQCLQGKDTSEELSDDSPMKMKMKNKKKSKRKRKLCGVEESIELCIAASEAVVISDMAAEDMHLNHFPVSSLLEVALRVKQARVECQAEHAENCFNNVTEQIDETYLLYDLDDMSMEDAFDDAGMPCTQVGPTPDGQCATKVIENHVDVTCLSAHQYVGKLTANRSHVFSAHDELKTDAAFSANALDYQPLLLSPRIPSLHQDEPLHNSSDCTTSHMNIQLKDQINEPVQSAIKDSAFNQAVPKEDIDLKGKKSVANLFLMESSYISESLDDFQGSKYVQSPEEDMEIASLNSVFNGEKRSLTAEHEISTKEILCSPDLASTSDFASIDPLCSMVPCSISPDAVNFIDLCEEKTFTDKNDHGPETTAGFSKNDSGPDTTTDFVFQSSCGDASRREGDKILSASGQTGDCRTEMVTTTKSHQVHRIVLNSLKAYSMVLPSGLPDTSLPEQNTEFHPSKNSEKSADYHMKYKRKTNQQAVEACNLVELPHIRGEISRLSNQNLPPRKLPLNDSRFLELEKPNKQSCMPNPTHPLHRRRVQAHPTEFNGRAEDAEAQTFSLLKTKCLRALPSRSSITPNDKNDLPSHAPRSSSYACAKKTHNSKTKRVRFSVAEEINFRSKDITGMFCSSKYKNGLPFRTYKRQRRVMPRKKLNIFQIEQGNELTFYGLQFLLTGFSRKKETEVEYLIRIHGGIVLQSIPPPPKTYLRRNKPGRGHDQHQIILALTKVQTTKFLYGCAINTLILSADWLHDSLMAGSMLSPEKYLILPNRFYEGKQLKNGQAHLQTGNAIFDGLGVMLYGKISFCSKYEAVIKHGGGQVFKTLHWLVQSLKNGKNSMGVILVEDENCVSRHLKHCAQEQDVNTVSASWIEDSLFSGILLPVKKDGCGSRQRKEKQISLDAVPEMSEEI